MNLTEFNQSDRCVYFSCPERSVSPEFYILLYLCSAAVVLLTICGNLLVIISVFHFRQLYTPTNMLVLSLSVSDFFIGSLVMPPVFIWTIESCWILHSDFCLCVWMTACFLMNLSVYHIVLIAADRYLALSNPFFYMNKVSVRIACAIMFLVWCLLVVYNVAIQYFNGNFQTFVMCPGECLFFVNKMWSIVDLVVTFTFPCSVIIILYSQVFVIAKKHATAIRELNHKWTKKHKLSHSIKSERKAAKVLGILVFVFLICLLPYYIYSLLGNVINVQLKMYQIVSIIFCINSTINPVIYALFYPWFRRCIKLILTLKIFQRDSALLNVIS